MFFDIILLNTQHRGQFGKAWIAGTRGIRYISKADVNGVNLYKLCDNIMKYVMTDTRSPQKRFSLRLTCILLNGTLRIFREQSIQLYAEICSILNTIRIPDGARGISEIDAREIFGSPLTPIVQVKRKKSRKQKIVVETPPVISDEFVEIKDLNIEDIIGQQATSDQITLRELAPKPTGQREEDDFGIATEEILPGILPPVRTTSSSSAGGPVIIQVEAQVHDGSRKQPEPVETEALPEENLRTTESSVLKEIQLSEQNGKRLPKSKVRRIPDVTAVHAEDIENIQIIEPGEKEATAQITPIATEKSVKATKEQDSLRDKELMKRENLYFSRQTKRIIRINKSDDKEGRFLGKPCVLETEYQNRDHTNLYNYFSFDDHVLEPVVEVRSGSRILGSSSTDSLGKIRPESLRRSTLNIDTAREARSSHGLTRMSEDIGSANVRVTDVPMEVELPGEPILPTSQEIVVPTLEMAKVQISYQQQKSLTQIEESVPGVDPAVESMSRVEQPVKSPETSVNHVQRRQDIINALVKWDFDRSFPTIIHITPKPITRSNVARTFSDLLALWASKLVILITEEDSLELKFIKLRRV